MNVRIYGTLRQFVGAKEVEVRMQPGDTVLAMLKAIAAQYPLLGERVLDEDGNLKKAINVLVNGRSIRFLDGLDSTLHEKDQVALFPAVGGG